MKQNYLLLFVLFVFIIGEQDATAQIETRLATNCGIGHVEIPINIKNLEDIKSFQLKLSFDNEILHLDTSYYHLAEFTADNSDNYKIHVSASNDTITIKWSAYYAVNITDDLLLSLVFSEPGSGEASFSWLEDECMYKNISGLEIDANYTIDGTLDIPYNNSVQITFDQFTKGCRDDSESGGCKAQAEVNIEGGVAPYTYHWNDKFNQNDSIAIGLCEKPISVIIRDEGGCVYGSIFDAEIFPAAVYTIEAFPEEVFITKPIVDFEIITEDAYIETYLWEFKRPEDGEVAIGTANTENATYVFPDIPAFYDISLRTENIDGCDTTVHLKNFEIKELNFCIPNVITPNGDGANDVWIFKILGAGSGGDDSGNTLKYTGYEDVTKCSGEDLIFEDHFKSSQLTIINRGGQTVYECSNCTEYWDGGGLPDGVYFYVFSWTGQYSEGKEQGNVTILGSKK